MNKYIARIMLLIMVGAIFINPSSLAEGQSSDVVKLIKEVEGYIEASNKEDAINTLNIAFDLANSLGDGESLMEIGDLYITIDKSLNEKAMKAWMAAGRSKCQ
jgi:hypothetical protein